MCKIRNLRADEIELRTKQFSDGNASVLLLPYKDARCDMKILDETFGVYGWQRTHAVINDNLFCSISIKNPDTGEWISKEDVGTESNTEKEKGEASDAFKRAATNVGIGRELYTAPAIWIRLETAEVKVVRDKPYLKAQFHVEKIETNDEKTIQSITIADSGGRERFVWSVNATARVNTPPRQQNVSQGKYGAAAAPSEPQAAAVTCDSCGAVITDRTGKTGDIIPAANAKSILGGLCLDCWRAQKAAKNAEATA